MSDPWGHKSLAPGNINAFLTVCKVIRLAYDGVATTSFYKCFGKAYLMSSILVGRHEIDNGTVGALFLAYKPRIFYD